MKKANWLVFLWFLLSPLPAGAALNSIAFFYGDHPPLSTLRAYDAVVLDPSVNLTRRQLNLQGSTRLAYVSLGETNQHASYFNQLQTHWMMGKNTTWNSRIMNAANADWRDFFINKVINPLWDKGYRGFFLDTLDAYQSVSKTEAERKAQTDGIVAMIQAIHTQHPDAVIVLNRGFELLPSVSSIIQGVAGESLFGRWNEAKHRYESVPQNDYTYLYNEFMKVKALGLPAISIDYVDPSQPKQAQAIADKIAALGIIPYVTDGRLQTVGTSNVHTLPRRIFVIYSNDNKKSTVFNPEAFTSLATPIEALGYIPEYHNAQNPLPSALDHKIYAGVIVLTSSLTLSQQNALKKFLNTAKQAGFYIAFLTNFGFEATPSNLAPYDISLTPSTNSGRPGLRILSQDDGVVGYEVQPAVSQYDFDFYHAKQAKVLLALTTPSGAREDAIAITAWGGYAMDPYVNLNTPDGDSMWVLNPFEFIRQALRLPTFPVPDITTENGRRLAFVHIDGDGFANLSQQGNDKISMEELKTKILEKYTVPTTFSVVTADIRTDGLYPQHAAAYQALAKSVFALPHIEAASHTFSHPFDWVKIKTVNENGKYNLPIKNYRYNDADEITGSIKTINDTLLSPEKRARVMLWSGYANMDERELSLAEEAGLLAMNGGSTVINNARPFLSLITPIGQITGEHYQVYAPIGNEEYYTNGWSKPLYGFRRVIETLQLTNAPIRLKPVDIYYHIYSASTEASLVALNEVYEWAMAQPLLWIYASDYIEKAHDAIETSVSLNNGAWELKSNGNVREFRYEDNFGYPDLIQSENIAGYNKANGVMYVHTGPGPFTRLVLSSSPPTEPILVESNARLTHFQRSKDGFIFKLKGNQPITFTLKFNHCDLIDNDSWMKSRLSGESIGDSTYRYHLKTKDSHELKLTCTS